MSQIKALLATQGAWHLPNTAEAFLARNALAGLWISARNRTPVLSEYYKACWSILIITSLMGKARVPQIMKEKTFYALLPLWQRWLSRQQFPQVDVVHGIMGFCHELFSRPEAANALKVVDCPNSHPASYYGYWQRECDLWCPGEQVPIPRWMFARMNRDLERADAIVVQSLFCKQSMLANGIPEDKIIVNPMGVDVSRFKKREVPPPQVRFICVGTICLRKGHQYLFRAFELVKQRLPSAELICVGEVKCDFRKEWPRWQQTFTHIPYVEHGEIAKLLVKSTAFVFPSQEEGIARAQIEALACGLPVIGTHEGGATTLVRDGIEGFIVPGRDPVKIAEAMIRIAEDIELNKKMGDAAYLVGGKNNSWQNYGDRLLEEYSRRLKRVK